MALQYDEIEKLLNDWKIPIITKDAQRIRGYPVDDYRLLAKQTETVDYDCDFRDGACRGRECDEQGCCWRCADTFGHWLKEEGPLDEDTLKKVAEYYDPVTGFCREEDGCVLPREFRSPTCLYIFCSDAKMSGEELDLLYRIRNGLSWAGDRA